MTVTPDEMRNFRDRLAFESRAGTLSGMTRLQQLETESMELTDSERATLAMRLLETLPPLLADTDEGIAEAIRRDNDLTANPQTGIAWETLRQNL